MGGFISTPVLTDVQTPTVLNFILQEMFRRSDLVDIYSLADPQRCDRYVVAGADALQTLFVKLRVNPMKKDGILYFQSVDGLTKGAPRNIKDKHRENCLELSFFFIRIFQIFGAVTLSMFDNSIPSVDPQDTNPEAMVKKQAFLQQKNFGSVPQKKSWFGSGGALRPVDKTFYIPDGPFKILNYYISRPDTGSTSSNSMTFPGFPMMSLDQKTLYDITQTGGEVTGRVLKSNPTPTVKYAYQRNSNQYVLTATMSIQGIDEYKITLSNYMKDGTPVKAVTRPEIFRTFAGDTPISTGQSYSKGKSLPTVLQAMFEDAGVQTFGAVPFSTVKLLRKMNYTSGQDDYTIVGTHIIIPGSQDNIESPRIIFRDSMQVEDKRVTVTITASLQIEEPIQDVTNGSYSYRVYINFSNSQIRPSEAAEFITLRSYKTTQFIAYSKDGIPKSESSNMTIPEYLESVFQGVIKGSKDDKDPRTRNGLPKPYNSDAIPQDLRIKELWNALAKDPPIKSYCIARAVQLLSVDAIRGNMSKPAFSSACSLSFAYQKNHSIPTPEMKLSDVPAMHALATLFWTDLETRMPKIQDEAKYKKFLSYMEMNLGNDPSEEPVEKMSAIVEELPPVCDNRDGARLQLTPAVSSKLRGVVNALISQQRAHINAGMQVIQQLFDMNSISNKVFAINPAVLSGGMPEVNRISGVARDILMKYYSGCEATYRDGLKILYQSDQQTPLVAVKADGSIIERKAT